MMGTAADPQPFRRTCFVVPRARLGMPIGSSCLEAQNLA